MNILVVEDSDDDYEVTVRAFQQLQPQSFNLNRCESGEEVLDYLRGRGHNDDGTEHPRPDLILLDLNIPGKDGKAVLREIKNDDNLKTIPVVILTTSDNQKDIQICYSRGANTYVRKTVDLKKFYQAIRCMMEYWNEVALLPKGEL